MNYTDVLQAHDRAGCHKRVDREGYAARKRQTRTRGRLALRRGGDR